MSRAKRLTLIIAVLVLLFVGYQAWETLGYLDLVERERDTWQRPHDIIRELALKEGNSVVDFGSGAGYFTLRLAPVVGPSGHVVAVDIRRESLAFLWMRSMLRGDGQIEVMLGREQDARLPAGPIDAVLIVNTYHELAHRTEMLRQISQPLKPGGRLVVADRWHREAARAGLAGHGSHALPSSVALAELRAAGFQVVRVDEAFIDRPSDDPWWLIVAQRP